MADPLDLRKWRQWGAYHWGALAAFIATLWSGSAIPFIIALLCLILIQLENDHAD
jgi:hypothetical protein